MGMVKTASIRNNKGRNESMPINGIPDKYITEIQFP